MKPPQKPSLLLTGGHGFIGTILGRYLAHEGYPIFFGDFDITQSHLIEKFVPNFPPEVIVLHMAGMSAASDCERDPVVAHKVNCEGAANVFKAFPKSPHFIYFGSGQVYKEKGVGRVCESDPIETSTVYAQTKRAAEIKLQGLATHSETRLTILRLFNHVHKTQGKNTFMSRIYHNLLDMRPPESDLQLKVGNLDVIRDLGAIQDLNLALAKLLQAGIPSTEAEIYNVASGAGKSLKKLVAKLAEKVGVSPQIELDQSSIHPAPQSMVGDPSRFCQQFGWQPRALDEDSLIELFVADFDKSLHAPTRTGRLEKA